ncbi:CPBP family intramembrane glutamic endopeptidase [Chryseolinea sp. H1M3-3]|uniref:CPBP family intramembrane glutamic endopeptidase n=1 Tax=Chryseolinea sp. H1M3-3 TaxID=3034144 RepID=UPI0023ED0F57|nr:CPBP family intramembrane glutamic endopeptidase [Chryseolinea sp. H1M3-3]
MIRNPPTWFLLFELTTLFIIFPLLYFFDLIPVHKIIPLVVLFVYCVIVLGLNKPINPDRFKTKANWKAIVVRFLSLNIVIFLWIKFFSSNALFADFSVNKQLLLMTLIYPVSSAFPQELIFREFFFYRYEPLLNHKAVAIICNMILFSFAHLYFANWTILLFTFVGGLIFSLTYLNTKSLLVVTIEHSLFGILILSSGLADQFYKAF